MEDKNEVAQKHPEYLEYAPLWETLEDCIKGENEVKKKGLRYLPPTQSMLRNGLYPQAGLVDSYMSYNSFSSMGDASYLAYIRRAVYHGFLDYAVTYALGLLHNKPPQIQLPARMEALRERITPNGQSINDLLRDINKQQLEIGRLGAFLDYPKQGTINTDPYIILYEGENIINWDGDDDNVSFVVLEEDDSKREGFKWKEAKRYRVLTLQDNVYTVQVHSDEGIFDEIVPSSSKSKSLDTIPFVFINSDSTSLCPSKPPFLDLANLSLAIYRGEADFRQALFMQGQDTPFFAGFNAEDIKDGVQIGSLGGVQSSNPDAKFTYVGVEGKGLDIQMQSLENDIRRAWQMAGALDGSSGQKESGEAIALRLAAQSSQLEEIAKTGAKALQRLLRIAAEWMGENPEDVVVTPNTDFVKEVLNPTEIVDLMKAKQLNAPISEESIFDFLKAKGFVRERTYDEEMSLIDQEEVKVMPQTPTVNRGLNAKQS